MSEIIGRYSNKFCFSILNLLKLIFTYFTDFNSLFVYVYQTMV